MVMARVLIVDGNEGERTRVSGELQAAGHEVDGAPDGVEAFELLLAVPCDVIVSEAELEKLALSELIAKLRARGVKAPVLVLTTVTRASAVAALMKMGIAAYLPKASPPEVLRQKVAELAGPTPPGETAPAPAAPPATGVALVIDGAEDQHQQLRALFPAATGLDGCATIKEGLARARNGAYRLVLLDSDAAVLNLAGVVAQFRALLPEAAVVATAKVGKGSDPASVARSIMELGFDDVLLRPFTAEAVALLDEQYCAPWDRLVTLDEDVVKVSRLRRRADQRERYLQELATRLEAALQPLSEACYEHAFFDLTRASGLLLVTDAVTLIAHLERAAATLGIAALVALPAALAAGMRGIDESLDQRGFRWFTSVAAARAQAGTPTVSAAT
jgi:DNA-binding response OmpR family regulator